MSGFTSAEGTAEENISTRARTFGTGALGMALDIDIGLHGFAFVVVLVATDVAHWIENFWTGTTYANRQFQENRDTDLQEIGTPDSCLYFETIHTDTLE